MVHNKVIWDGEGVTIDVIIDGFSEGSVPYGETKTINVVKGTHSMKIVVDASDRGLIRFFNATLGVPERGTLNLVVDIEGIHP